MEVIVWGATDEKVDDLVEKIIARSETWKILILLKFYTENFMLYETAIKENSGLSFEFI